MSVEFSKTENFKYGTINRDLEDRTIPRGAASSSLNWLTKGDHIELRRGYRVLGDVSRNVGIGRVTGIRKILNNVSVEMLFYTYGQKAKYFDRSTEEWVEISTNLLGAAADDEDISMEYYVTNSGNQLWLNSPNCSGYYKIMVANPGDPVDHYDASKNFKGYIKIDTNRTKLWGRVKDRTGVYGSYIDTQTYTTVTAEAIGGAGATRSGTLAFKGGGSRRTCFGVVITDGSETFTDDYNGVLTGSAGGTGTINYATGAYSVTFAVAPGAPVTADYQWEDSNAAGISDFTKSSPRTAGQGFIFRQDDGGGPMQNLGIFNNTYYCFHLKKTWELTIGLDDTDATNLPYRERVGIPNLRASVDTGHGIYYIDDTDRNDPKARRLDYETTGSSKVIPIPVSNNIRLSDFRFDKCAAFEIEDLVLFSCRRATSEQNDRTIVYNTLWEAWDIIDYAVSCYDIYDGALMGGDSLSDNVMELFSGWDDDDSTINNFWIGHLDDLDLEGLKKSKHFRIQGAIASEQKLRVYISLDNGPFVEIGTDDDHEAAIEGSGDYIDRTTAVTIGPTTIGRAEVGGGGDAFQAYNYDRCFKIATDKFEKVKIKYEAVGLGYVSVSTQYWWDVRFKGVKPPRQYRG